jgi:hypothetical protein
MSGVSQPSVEQVNRETINQAESTLDDFLLEWTIADIAKDRKIERLEQELADLRYFTSTIVGCVILDASQGVTRH